MMINSLFLKKFKKPIFLIRSSISYKLFLVYLLVISIPVLIFGIISYNLSASTVEKDFIKYKQSLNSQIVKNIEENIESLQKQSASLFLNLDEITYYLSMTPDRLEDKYFDTSKRLNNYFLSILQNNERMDGIALIDASGEVKYFIDKQLNPTNLISVNGEKWFKETLALKGSPLFLEPHESQFIFINNDPLKQKMVISISRAINDMYSGKCYGVLVFDQNIDQFEDMVANVEIQDQEFISIFGKSGDLIFSNFNPTPEIIDSLKSITDKKNQDSIKFLLHNKKVLVSFSTSPKYGWKVVSLLPVSVLQGKSQFLKSITMTLLVILIVFILILSILTSNVITIPLKKLMLSFIKLQHGDFNASITVKGFDELALIGNTFNSMVSNIKNLIEQKYEMNILRKQAELESLQSQINPHFLYNTLNSIKAVAEKKEHEKVGIMVQNLSEIFRYSLNKGKFEVKFSEELNIVQKYLYLQECRYRGKYDVFYDIDNQVLNYSILRLTLQPLVENAIYHGLEPKRGKGELRIAARKVADKYNIYISNTGMNIPEEELIHINSILDSNPEKLSNTKPDRMGIYNVNARIKFHFGNEYGLKIYSAQDSNTTVRIVLPAQ